MNIVVPVDFTPVAMNAAHFAAKMLVGQYETTLVLYHAYSDAREEAAAEENLRKLKDALLHESIVHIETIAEESGDFLDSLERKVRYLDAVLVGVLLGPYGVTRGNRADVDVRGGGGGQHGAAGDAGGPDQSDLKRHRSFLAVSGRRHGPRR